MYESCPSVPSYTHFSSIFHLHVSSPVTVFTPGFLASKTSQQHFGQDIFTASLIGTSRCFSNTTIYAAHRFLTSYCCKRGHHVHRANRTGWALPTPFLYLLFFFTIKKHFSQRANKEANTTRLSSMFCLHALHRYSK
jgi:hypothetical protein